MQKWREVSLALAALPMLGEASAFARDRELGQYLSTECLTCHRPSGQAVGGVPQIFGWPEDQFIAVMHAYKHAHRDNPVMQTIAGRLGEEEIAALAAYFGELHSSSTAR
jgi:cytochrome c